MSDQIGVIDSLFRKRMMQVENISQANAEHLRILQLSSGVEVLMMKEQDSSELIQRKTDIENQIATSLAHLAKLDSELTQIDKQINNALTEEP